MSATQTEFKGEDIEFVWARFTQAVRTALHDTTSAAICESLTHGCDALDIRQYIEDGEALEKFKSFIHQVGHAQGKELTWKDSTNQQVTRPYVTTESFIFPMGTGSQLVFLFVLHRAEA